MATEASIILRAYDASAAAFASFAANLKGAERSIAQLSGSIGTITKVTSALGGLASAAGAVAIVNYAKGVVSAAAALDDMAERTGATVEGLSRIQQVAAKTGQDFGLAETAMTRLSKTLSPLAAESKGAAVALKAIGLSIDDLRALRPDQQIETVARALNGFEDSAAKAQLAQELFGKTGAQVLPLLKELAEDTDTLAVTTARQAAEAEALEKQWARAEASLRNMADAVVKSALPAFNKLAAAIQAGGLGGGLIAGIAASETDNLAPVIQRIQAQADRFAQQRQGFPGGILGGVLSFQEGMARNAVKGLLAIQGEQELALGDGAYSNAARGAGAGGGKAALHFDAVKKGAKKAKAAHKALREETDLWSESIQRARHVQSLLDHDLDQVARAMKEIEAREQASRDLVAAGEADAIAARDRAQEDLRTARERLETIGLEAPQLAELTAARLESNAALADESAAALEAMGAQGLLIDAYRDQAAALREQAAVVRSGAIKDAAIEYEREWKDISRNIGDYLGDALLGAFESGGRGGASFAQALGRDLRSILLREISQGLGALAGGAVTSLLRGAGAGFGGAGGAGGLGNALGLGNSLSGLFGGGSLATSLVGAPVAGLASGLGASTGVATGLGAFAASAVPYIGAAMALYSLFGGRRGGPKTGGDVNMLLSSSGIRDLGDIGNLHDYTPSDANAGLSGYGMSLAQQIDARIRALGGKPAGDIQIYLGQDADPQGTAGNRVSSGLAIDGRTIFRTLDRSVEDIAAGLGEESQRILVGALREMDLYDAVDAILDTVNPATASVEQMTQALAAADEAMQAIGSQADAYRSALQGIAQTMQDVHNSFAGSIRDIQLGQLDSRGKYEFLDAEIQRYTDVLASLSDPTLIQDYATRLNSLYMDAYNLLDPSQQRGVADEFISRLTQADELAMTRLEAANRDVQERFSALPEEIRTAIVSAMDSVVARISAAVPRQVAIDVRVDRAAEVEVGIGR